LFNFFFHCFLLFLLLKFCENERHAMDWGHCEEHTRSLILYQFFDMVSLWTLPRRL
jgi:hypothetical protein